MVALVLNIKAYYAVCIKYIINSMFAALYLQYIQLIC